MYAHPHPHGRSDAAAYGYGDGGFCVGYVSQYLVLVFGSAPLVYHGASYQK